MISVNVSSTADSDLEKPSTNEFVESDINNLIPFSPNDAIFCKLAIGPIGVKSNL